MDIVSLWQESRLTVNIRRSRITLLFIITPINLSEDKYNNVRRKEIK